MVNSKGLRAIAERIEWVAFYVREVQAGRGTDQLRDIAFNSLDELQAINETLAEIFLSVPARAAVQLSQPRERLSSTAAALMAALRRMKERLPGID